MNAAGIDMGMNDDATDEQVFARQSANDSAVAWLRSLSDRDAARVSIELALRASSRIVGATRVVEMLNAARAWVNGGESIPQFAIDEHARVFDRYTRDARRPRVQTMDDAVLFADSFAYAWTSERAVGVEFADMSGGDEAITAAAAAVHAALVARGAEPPQMVQWPSLAVRVWYCCVDRSARSHASAQLRIHADWCSYLDHVAAKLGIAR